MAKKKSTSKKSSAKVSKPKKAKKQIMVVSASDRNEARRALAFYFKMEKPNIIERNKMRREQRESFKNY